MSQTEPTPRPQNGIWRGEIDYELPKELIAQAPAAERDGSRLLVLERGAATLEHRRFHQLADLLRPGDCLVANDSRVFPARLIATKPTGGRVELLVLDAEGRGPIRALLRSSKPLRRGQVLLLGDGSTVRVVAEPVGGRAELDFGDARIEDVLVKLGRTPLPPYIARPSGEDTHDEERYQTVYARETGSVAAPTAGLHLSVELLGRLSERGIGFETVTLHVGPGTFTPVRGGPLVHRMEAERCRVSAATVERLREVRARRGRIVAVGTTVVRALESAAAGSSLAAFDGPTELFIRPGYRFRAVDALVTNFHLPGSTLLCLTLAFGGRELVRRAYEQAVSERYRFYSYGDAMLVM